MTSLVSRAYTFIVRYNKQIYIAISTRSAICVRSEEDYFMQFFFLQAVQYFISYCLLQHVIALYYGTVACFSFFKDLPSNSISNSWIAFGAKGKDLGATTHCYDYHTWIEWFEVCLSQCDSIPFMPYISIRASRKMTIPNMVWTVPCVRSKLK